MNKKGKTNDRERTFLLITIPVLVLFFCFNTLPLIKGFIYSFTNFKGYGTYDFVGLRNYKDLFTDARVGRSYLFTFKYAIVCTIIVNVISLLLALEEAARVDGATTWSTYWNIIFPIMKPMHATVAVLTAMSTWNDVMTPLVIMSGTGKNTLPLAQLNFQTQFGTNYNLAFASYLLALLPILIFYLICQKQIINGVVNGAVK